ncbi:MAG: RNA polymerase sigma factor [Patescibacteria group bacterium]|nr:RNA polymerase sigma factor [Patescibacteria group bacterium]
MDDLPSLTDEQIVLLIQGGDKEKYGLLMTRYDKKLSRYGRKFLSEKENIEDIVQDVFISAFQNINNFDTSLKFSSWIYRIAHNAFVNGLKRQQRSAVLGLDLDTFVSHMTYEDPAVEERDHEIMKKMIDQGLEKLTPKCREVIILHYLEGLSYKEISDILQIPTGTVAVRVLRGKDALRKIYKKMNMDYEQ